MRNPGTLALTAAHLLLLLLLGTSAAPTNDSMDVQLPPNPAIPTMEGVVGDKPPPPNLAVGQPPNLAVGQPPNLAVGQPPNLVVGSSKTDDKSSISAPSSSPTPQAVLKPGPKQMTATPATSIKADSNSGKGVKTAEDADTVSTGKDSTGSIIQEAPKEDTAVKARVDEVAGMETKPGGAEEVEVAESEAKTGVVGNGVVGEGDVKGGGDEEAKVAESDTKTGDAGEPVAGEKDVSKPQSQPLQNTTRDDNSPKVPAPPPRLPTSSPSPMKPQEKAPPVITSTTTTPTPVDKNMGIRPPEPEDVGLEEEEEEDKDEDGMLGWPIDLNRDSLPSLQPQGPGGGGGGGGEMTEGGQFTDDEGSHFFAYFLTVMVTAIIFYLVFHNKQRIMALIIEGRAPNSRRRRRNSSRARYTRLDNTLEEAITATRSDKSDHRAL